MRRALLAAASLGFCVAMPMTGAVARNPVVGEHAPPLHLSLLDGSEVNLDQLRGNVIVINFWATWCGPCKAELPILDAFARVNAKAGLKVFAITTEDSVPVSRLKPLAALLGIPLVRHKHGNFDIMGAVPTNYVIDRAGIVRYAKAGAFTIDSVNALLVPLLQEPVPAEATPVAATTASRGS